VLGRAPLVFHYKYVIILKSVAPAVVRFEPSLPRRTQNLVFGVVFAVLCTVSGIVGALPVVGALTGGYTGSTKMRIPVLGFLGFVLFLVLAVLAFSGQLF